MKTLIVTGGIATGKSTFIRLLMEAEARACACLTVMRRRADCWMAVR